MPVRLGVHATFATIEAHTSHVDVVDHRLVVDVCDVNAPEVCNGPVVEEGTTTPVAALKANTAVTVTVVDSTVEPYVRAPIAGMPGIHAASPTPIAGCPQQTRGGCDDPCARYPVIVAVAVGPIAGCPDIANRGAGWLDVYGQSRRSDVNGDSDRDERKGRHRQCRQRETRQCSSGGSEAERFVSHDDLVAIVV